MKHLLMCSVVGVGMAAAGAVAAAEPVDLRFATVGVGSAWYTYGAGIAELALGNLPEGSNIDVLPVAGGVGNITLVETGEAEIGLTHINIVAEACSGSGQFDSVQDNVRALIGGLDNYYYAAFVTLASEVESWDEIVDAKGGFGLVTVSVGGVGELGTRQVLEIMGSSYDDIASKGGSVRHMDRPSTAQAIADGDAHGWAHIVTAGHPIAMELATAHDMRVLPLADNVIEGMSELGWAPATLPANTFPGQTEDVSTVTTPTVIIVNSDVPEDAVYEITRSIIENAERLPDIHAGLQDFDLENAVDPQFVGGCPFHPGAERAFREAGLM